MRNIDDLERFKQAAAALLRVEPDQITSVTIKKADLLVERIMGPSANTVVTKHTLEIS